MSVLGPFRPSYKSNQVLNATSSSQSVAINPINKVVHVVNSGANIAYFSCASSNDTTAASTASCPILAGQTLNVEKGDTINQFNYISAAGTTLQVMTGEGGI